MVSWREPIRGRVVSCSAMQQQQQHHIRVRVVAGGDGCSWVDKLSLAASGTPQELPRIPEWFGGQA